MRRRKDGPTYAEKRGTFRPCAVSWNTRGEAIDGPALRRTIQNEKWARRMAALCRTNPDMRPGLRQKIADEQVAYGARPEE